MDMIGVVVWLSCCVVDDGLVGRMVVVIYGLHPGFLFRTSRC